MVPVFFFCNGRLILSLEQTSLFKLFPQYLSKERKILSKKVFPISDDENKYNTWIFGKGIFGRKQAQNGQKVENHTASIRSVYFRINEIEKERFKRKKEALGKTNWIFVVII